MNLKTTHTFPIDVKTFWEKLYFHEEYNRALYLTQIGAKSYEVVECKDTEKTLTRRVKITPKQSAPSILQKMLKGEFTYVEEGTFHKADGTYRFQITPSMMPEKIKVSGVVTAVAAGDKSVKRTIDLSLKADVFAVGGQIEKFVGGEITRGYDESYEFTMGWIKKHGL